MLQSIGVLTAWAALLGFGTFGTFTELPSRTIEIPDDAPLTSAG